MSRSVTACPPHTDARGCRNVSQKIFPAQAGGHAALDRRRQPVGAEAKRGWRDAELLGDRSANVRGFSVPVVANEERAFRRRKRGETAVEALAGGFDRGGVDRPRGFVAGQRREALAARFIEDEARDAA